MPEAAAILFQGGFPRSTEPGARRAGQTTIFHVQRNPENVQAAIYPQRVLLCDRGTVDGAADWRVRRANISPRSARRSKPNCGVTMR